MSLAIHHAAQEISQQAATLRLQGAVGEARTLYAEAADLERRALDGIPAGQPRTRGILSVSAVALYYKARLYPQAEFLAYRLLADDQLPDFARTELRELLIEIWNEQHLGASVDTTRGANIEVALRGGAIGVGAAPIGVARQKLDFVERFLYRVVEWQSHLRFRETGPPPPAVRDRWQLFASQPLAGSFRFQIRLAQTPQQPLPGLTDEVIVDPAEVATSFLSLIRAVVAPTLDPSTLERMVPEPDYRDAFLKIVRNMAPDGRQVHEMEFRQIDLDPAEAIILHEGIRTRIRAIFTEGTQLGKGMERRVGTLRALHLDQKWLEVILDDTTPFRCNIEHLLLDDVVGPMVNHTVTVTGHWRRRNKQSQFVLADIEPGDLGESVSGGMPPSRRAETIPLL